MSKPKLKTVVMFDGPVELVMVDTHPDTRRPMKGHKHEGGVSRWFIKYRNGDSNVTAQNVPKDRFMYWPIWFGDTLCPKFKKDVLAEAQGGRELGKTG